MFIVNPRTQEALDVFLQEPIRALMLVGPDGIGKGSIAALLAASLLSLKQEVLEARNAFKHITPDEKGTIPIESVRQLQQYVKLKTTGSAKIRRVILVEHADRMTTEAQNAFLKLLEEPPEDTVLLITAAYITSLLPTIRSRVQQLIVAVPAKEELVKAFSTTTNADHVNQAYFLSGGLPGLMSALLDEDATHPLVASVAEAKQVLQQSLFERLLHIEPLSKQKELAIMLCEALERIADAGLQQSAGKNDAKRIEKWHTILKQAHLAKRNFQANGNTKLIMTNLLLQI